MTRRWMAATGALAMLLAGAGCTATPPGVDGNLTNGWAAIGTPTPFRPAGHACHSEVGPSGGQQEYAPVDCAGPHLAETYHLGTLTGSAAGAEVPDSGSPAGRTAYRECSTAATAFVGAPWRTGRLGLWVVWPSSAAWSGGARWFRCDLVQTELDGTAVNRKGSLARGLAGRAPLRLGCFNPSVHGGSVSTMAPVGCQSRHRAEFAGVWPAPDVSYERLAGDDARTAKGCRGVIAAYAGVPDDADMKYRSGWISYNPTRGEWQQGERGVRCFLWFSDRQLTRSMKGAGKAGLPVS